MGNSQNVDNITNSSPKYDEINLTPNDSTRQLAIELVKQAYNTVPSQEKSLERAKMLADVLSTDEMIRTALHLSQRTYTGFYSISFNQEVRNLKIRQPEGCLILNSKEPEGSANLESYIPQDYFPEVYNNNNLTSLEKSELEKCYIREFHAMCNAFKQAEGIDNPKFFRECQDCNIPDDEMDDLYSQCYNQICITENLKATQSLYDASQATFSSPMNNQMIVDTSPYGEVSWIYYLPTKDLLMAVISDQKNPLTNKYFSPETIEKVKNNFPTELKLIEYAVQN